MAGKGRGRGRPPGRRGRGRPTYCSLPQIDYAADAEKAEEATDKAGEEERGKVEEHVENEEVGEEEKVMDKGGKGRGRGRPPRLRGCGRGRPTYCSLPQIDYAADAEKAEAATDKEGEEEGAEVAEHVENEEVRVEGIVMDKGGKGPRRGRPPGSRGRGRPTYCSLPHTDYVGHEEKAEEATDKEGEEEGEKVEERVENEEAREEEIVMDKEGKGRRRGRPPGSRGRGRPTYCSLPHIDYAADAEKAEAATDKAGEEEGAKVEEHVENEEAIEEEIVMDKGGKDRRRGRPPGSRGRGRGRGRGRTNCCSLAGEEEGAYVEEHVENGEPGEEEKVMDKAVEEGDMVKEKEKGGGNSTVDSTGERLEDGVRVALFDYSVENHFHAIDTISSICGTAEDEMFSPSDVQRFSSAVTFLTEWKHFSYQPKNIRFSYETGAPQEKEVTDRINLPQFSATSVPKMERQFGNRRFWNSSKDFVLHVGGHVWALDWCPRSHQKPDYHRIKSEYLAVAAHPPESSYHKIGTPLIGRGLIQIWCFLNANSKEELSPLKPKRRGRKRLVRIDSLDDLSTAEIPSVNRFVPTSVAEKSVLGSDGRADELKTCEGSSHEVLGCELGSTTSRTKRRKKDEARERGCDDSPMPFLPTFSEDSSNLQANDVCDQGMDASNKKTNQKVTLKANSTAPFANDVALPRVVLCLAHNAKVAWDVKWRPSIDNDPEYKHRMGYLAVLLGNGFLEVWEVPFPSMIKSLYTSLGKPGTDPRFVKLEPVFRCSKMKCGDRQSIPLTLEWSTSAPHDLLLAGCHDGTVALWKFSARGSTEDTRPLLCFKADTVPVRALAWAPNGSDAETANLIATAGHEGVRFWDIRDPYRPLWDLSPVRRVLSLDWLHEPRCIILAVDDGTLRILALSKAAYDTPVTGKPFIGKPHQGFHSFNCSSFSIWSVQVSRFTGQVAYCGADGFALRFQLTSKAVEKDTTRNKAPHFLCSSLTEEDSTLNINIPLGNTPFPMKKSQSEWADTPSSVRGFHLGFIQAKRAPNQSLVFSNLLANPSIKVPKPKGSRKKNDPSTGKCIIEFEGQESSDGRGEQPISKCEYEVLPPKIVAMHRVRWNMNKGSERWLCYGGAAGIVRCTEINL